jgi:RHS repeat-associated protein
VSGGLLTAFTPAYGNSGNYTTTFAYQAAGTGTGTVLLQKRIGVLGDTTVVTYDAAKKNRPTQATLPKVKDESGSDVTPTVAYVAVETRGIGALVPLDSSGAYVELRDPRNNWVRSWPNRWGQARLTWDSLGRLGRSSQNGDGFVRWSEGKVADSTRTWLAYDNLWRVVKQYIVRPAGEGGVLRVDSLVYDANHRVIQRIDARGQVRKTDYDTHGNAIRSIQPNVPGPDTTLVWYLTDGMVDSTRAPGDAAATLLKYSGTAKILTQTITPSRDTVERSLQFDGYGRVYQVDRKVPITPSKVQWRRTQTFYNGGSNLVDSTRVIHTVSCDTPCGTPTWPGSLDTDSVLVQRIRYVYDRAGRDSLRINDRGIPMLTLRDRLGRVTKAYPYGVGVSEVDSFAYDVAGNLKKTWTRRGDLILADYDSRGRDTLQVIPNVGTLRKAYAGPLDQLSRVWITGLVDSIGGARPDVSLVYDRRGRLKADTAWAGGQAQVTSYATDRYERDSLMTDALGSWRTKYETTRGLVDTLATPLLDTLILSFDHQGRLVADSVRNGGLRLTNAMSYTTDGAPKRWSTAMQVPSTWAAGADDNLASQGNVLPALQPIWTQLRGSGGAADTLRATGLEYDGLERLTSWSGTGSLGGGVNDGYTFDRAGNLSTSGVEQFDATTNRMTRRSNGANRAWRYSYDAAGNLTQAVDSGTSSVTYSYRYDALNRLVQVNQGATLIARYAYDVLGRRIAKRVYSAVTGGVVGFTRFVYHGGQVAFETDSLGTTIGTRYIWGPGTDNLVAFRTSASTADHYYVATDKLGSVHQIIKRDGAWVMSYAYAPYGSLTTTLGSGVALRYRWTGREYDAETGWYFHRARYYDPGQRRFVQEDPAGLLGGENRYAYVRGRALVERDPSGNWGEGGPPQPFLDPCASGGCSERGLYIDGVFASGWNVEMVPWSSIAAARFAGNAAFAYTMAKCNSSEGCVEWKSTPAVQAAKQTCSENEACNFLAGKLSKGGHRIRVEEGECFDPRVPGCGGSAQNESDLYLVILNRYAYNDYTRNFGALYVDGQAPIGDPVVLAHEFAHVWFNELLDLPLITDSKQGCGFAVSMENWSRSGYANGGTRIRHGFGDSGC